MDCPASLAHAEVSESVLLCASTLHRFGFPYDYVLTTINQKLRLRDP
jgi:hypothetical protein